MSLLNKVHTVLVIVWLLTGIVGVILGFALGGHHYEFDEPRKRSDDYGKNKDLSVLYLDITANHPFTWGKDSFKSSYNLTVIKYSLNFDVWDSVIFGNISKDGKTIQINVTALDFQINGMVINYNASFVYFVYLDGELSELPETLKEKINSIYEYTVEVHIYHSWGKYRRVSDFGFKYIFPFGIGTIILLIGIKLDEVINPKVRWNRSID